MASKAFTLLELIVVITIMGLLSLIAVPTFSKVIANSENQTTLSGLHAYARDVQALRALDLDPFAASHFDAAAEDLDSEAAVYAGADPVSDQLLYGFKGEKAFAALRSPSGAVCVVTFGYTSSSGVCEAGTNVLEGELGDVFSDPEVILIPQVPAAPSGFSAVASGARVSASWDAVAGATSYKVTLQPTAGDAVVRETSDLSVEFDGVLPGSYVASVSASNAEGSSAASAPATFSVESFADVRRVLAEQPQSGAFFGQALALDGDTLVVGSPTEAVGGFNAAGAAYVFVRDGSSWVQQGKLLPTSPAASDAFGTSVAVQGDTVVVGSPQEDPNNRSNSGAAYVFKRTGALWAVEGKLLASDPGVGDNFGIAVTLHGDTAVVGAFMHNPDGLTDAGAAYVYTRSGSSWSFATKLTANDKKLDDRFGYSLDYDGVTLVSSAVRVDTGSLQDVGAVYVFRGSGSSWTQDAKLFASNVQAGAQFGRAVAVSGELVAVGAHYEDLPSMIDAGAAYVFKHDGNVWSEEARVTAPDPKSTDYFGRSLAVDGNLLVVGAWQRNFDDVTDSGAAYVFERSGSFWEVKSTLAALTPERLAYFGYFVDVSSGTVVVGSYAEDPGGVSNAGAVYLFR